MSGRNAQEALRRAHARGDVPPDAPLQVHPDPAVPGANYVDGFGDARFWVGLQGECVRTSTGPPVPRRNGEFQTAHNRYTTAVERVRRHYATPVVEELFAVPDTHCPGAFFVYDVKESQTVRWVDPDGGVHDGYRLVDDTPQWDDATVTARTGVLDRQSTR